LRGSIEEFAKFAFVLRRRVKQHLRPRREDSLLRRQ
jgi:hypothetical protein